MYYSDIGKRERVDYYISSTQLAVPMSGIIYNNFNNKLRLLMENEID